MIVCSTCGTENKNGDKFCEQCGSPLDSSPSSNGSTQQPLAAGALVQIDDPDSRPYVLGSRTVIGRLDTNDLAVNDKSVSREHARLSRLRDGYVVEDLGSTNGTLVNGRRIDEAVILRPGDVLTVGSVDFRFQQEEPQAQQQVGADQPAAQSAVAEERVPAEFAAGEPEPDSQIDSAESRIPTPDFGPADYTAPSIEAVGNTFQEPDVQNVENQRSDASLSVQDAVIMADQLREIVQSLSRRVNESEARQGQLEDQARRSEEADNLRTAVREALDQAPAQGMNDESILSLNEMLDSLIQNPRDITILMNIANHAEAIRQVVDDASHQRAILGQIGQIVAG